MTPDNRIDLMILNYPIVLALADAGQTTVQVQVGNEYDFEAFELRGSIYKLAAPTGPVRAELRSSGGLYLTENQLDLFQICAQNIQNYSGYPMRITPGTIFSANTILYADYTNNSGAAVNIQLSWIGKKHYK